MFKNSTLPFFATQSTLQRYYPWIMAFSGLIILMVVNGLTTTSLTVYDKILEDSIFGGHRDELKFKETLANGTSALFVIVSGIFLDKFGVKKIMLWGIALLTVTFFLYSYVETKMEVYFAHFLLGIALVMGGSIPAIILVSTWFKKYKGVALGITLAGTSAGGIFLPQFIRHFIESYGWRQSFQILSLFPLGLFIYVVLFVKNSPKDIGGVPLGEESDAQNTHLLNQGMFYKDAIKTRTFWLVCLCGMFGFYSIVSLISNTFLYALGLGFSEKEAAYMVSLYFLVAMLGKFLISAIADFVNKFWLIRICFIGMTIGSVGYAMMDNEIIPWAIGLTALSWGGMYTMYNVVTISTFGLKESGKINGTISFFESLGAFVGPYLAGRLFVMYHSYEIAFYLVSFLMFLATILSFFFKNEAKEITV